MPYAFVVHSNEMVCRKMGRLWLDPVIRDGNSNFWHQKYSLPCTKVLSFVACIITSKIPVIGASNRSWDDVKTIKSGKIYSLSSDVSEKQSIIYTYAFI